MSSAASSASGKDAHISKLYVFDSRLGTTEETEHEKILFYYPAATSLDEQQKDVGLAEALINFTKTFSPEKPCSAFHTNKTLQAFWEAEKCVWMVLVVRRGSGGKEPGKEEREPADVCLDAALRHAYELVRLFNGGFRHDKSEAQVSALRAKLSLLLPPFLASLPPVSQLALPYSLRGIRYFPVDRQTFLSFQSFFHLAQQDFASIAHGLCVYSDMMVWSSLPEAADTNMLYSYIVTQLSEPESSGFASRKSRALPPAKDPEAPPLFFPYNKIWILPLDLSPFAPHQLVSIAAKIPTVHLSAPNQDSAPPAFRLVVFRHNQEPLDSSSAFLEHLAAFVANPIKKYERTLAVLENRSQIGEEPYRYLYFNGMNLALKDTLAQAGGKGVQLSNETQSLLLDMHAAFTGSEDVVGNGGGERRAEKRAGNGEEAGGGGEKRVEGGGGGEEREGDGGEEGEKERKEGEFVAPREICVKTTADGWLVGRKSNGRELYVISDSRASNIVDVNEEVERISSHYFSNIFI